MHHAVRAKGPRKSWWASDHRLNMHCLPTAGALRYKQCSTALCRCGSRLTATHPNAESVRVLLLDCKAVRAPRVQGEKVVRP